MQESKAGYEDAATGAVFTGRIVGLDGNRVVADVSSATGVQLRLLLSLRIDVEAGTVGGTVHARQLSESE